MNSTRPTIPDQLNQGLNKAIEDLVRYAIANVFSSTVEEIAKGMVREALAEELKNMSEATPGYCHDGTERLA